MSLFGDLAGAALGAAAQFVTGSQAANAQRDAARDALNLSQDQFNQLLALNRPAIDLGQQATNRLGDIFVTGAVPFTAAPGAEFRRQEGIDALDRSAASRGRLFSGPQARAVTEFGQNFATNEFNNEFNRLASLAGLGQVGTGNVGNASNVLSSIGSGALTNAGDARASGFINTGNTLNDFINTVFKAIP